MEIRILCPKDAHGFKMAAVWFVSCLDRFLWLTAQWIRSKWSRHHLQLPLKWLAKCCRKLEKVQTTFPAVHRCDRIIWEWGHTTNIDLATNQWWTSTGSVQHFTGRTHSAWQIATANKFDRYCTSKKNLTLEIFHFSNCNRQADEIMNAYLTWLKTHNKNCEFGDLHDSLVKDWLLSGVIHNVTREGLLRDEDLSLKKDVKIC